MYNWPTPHGADFKNEFVKKITQKNPLRKYQFKNEILKISKPKNNQLTECYFQFYLWLSSTSS